MQNWHNMKILGPVLKRASTYAGVNQTLNDMQKKKKMQEECHAPCKKICTKIEIICKTMCAKCIKYEKLYSPICQRYVNSMDDMQNMQTYMLTIMLNHMHGIACSM
jgi:hypothetical protein